MRTLVFSYFITFWWFVLLSLRLITDYADADIPMEPSNSENLVAASLPGDRYISQLLLENRFPSFESLSLTIPSDHMRMIQNINTLIAEVDIGPWNS